MTMESREYRGSSSNSSVIGSDPFWLLAAAIVVLTLFTIGLLAILLGFFAWRSTTRFFEQHGYHWKLKFACWFVLLLPAALLISYFYHHGLQQMINTQLGDVVAMAKHAQFDLSRWNFGRLWSETWPVWLRTLVAFPLVGVWQEVSTKARGGQAAKILVQSERSRERRVARGKLRARKRTLRPERLPDSVAGMMVMGVPIDGDEEQE